MRLVSGPSAAGVDAQLPAAIPSSPRSPILKAMMTVGNGLGCLFALAAQLTTPHIAIVKEAHPYSIKIEPDPLDERRRFRWCICEGTRVHLRSLHSYSTQREAEDEANKAMQKRVSEWRDNK